MAVMFGMRLAGFGGMVMGMMAMARCGMGMVRRRIGVFFFIMLGGFAMMMRGALMMLRGELVMFGGAFSVSHVRLLVCARVLRTGFNSAIVRQDRDAQARAPRLKDDADMTLR